MIADQQIGEDFMGALYYNMKKMEHPDERKRAKLLDSNFAAFNFRLIRKEVDLLRQLRPNLNRYVYHTSLNFREDELDRLDNDKMLAIAYDYLERNGFSNNQYLIFRHYDAGHPHLHLLVNRISFDGRVVSDSNNYKRSEAVLRELEREYNLIPVLQSSFKAVHQQNKGAMAQHSGEAIYLPNNRTEEPDNWRSQQHMTDVTMVQANAATLDRQNIVLVRQGNRVTRRPPRKNELEMMQRTGRSSEKILLQEIITQLTQGKRLSLQDFINKCEIIGIGLLFNQASTGRVSGITYFHGDFKIKGQALGNRFKWAELIRNIDYQQKRDSKAISEANQKTLLKYGPIPQGELAGPYKQVLDENAKLGTEVKASISPISNEAKELPSGHLFEPVYEHSGIMPGIQISDDIDDEAVLGRNRQRKKMARTNQR